MTNKNNEVKELKDENLKEASGGIWNDVKYIEYCGDCGQELLHFTDTPKPHHTVICPICGSMNNVLKRVN